MKTHKKGLDCGTCHRLETENNNEVTCKKCLRLIADDKPSKLYEVSFNVIENLFIEAPTASKAIYKAFKMFYYDGEACESIGEQFRVFRAYDKPKASLCKDSNQKRTLTYEEEHELIKKETLKKADKFNAKYPVGTDVLFQGDGKDSVVVTQTRSKATAYDSYMTIFLEGVSGSYKLDDRFVRVLTDENMNLERLRD
ncbi:hypothetical protein [Arcobacter roscoffensis]|uniref:Uncharacterized protein n=1 Tax=Arcobacter roscoffensis TaxID=2961520 RepID=A0ABY5E2Z4_9BACT|nr:hypothetical protein [Arcobacter roscoffensis]UTJ05418.1 hypothetical protein NJU99_09070 [Arcobacter roscoffensis]